MTWQIGRAGVLDCFSQNIMQSKNRTWAESEFGTRSQMVSMAQRPGTMIWHKAGYLSRCVDDDAFRALNTKSTCRINTFTVWFLLALGPELGSLFTSRGQPNKCCLPATGHTAAYPFRFTTTSKQLRLLNEQDPAARPAWASTWHNDTACRW